MGDCKDKQIRFNLLRCLRSSIAKVFVLVGKTVEVDYLPSIPISRLIDFHEVFHALNVAFGKVDHITKFLDQIFSVLQ